MSFHTIPLIYDLTSDLSSLTSSTAAMVVHEATVPLPKLPTQRPPPTCSHFHNVSVCWVSLQRELLIHPGSLALCLDPTHCKPDCLLPRLIEKIRNAILPILLCKFLVSNKWLKCNFQKMQYHDFQANIKWVHARRFYLTHLLIRGLVKCHDQLKKHFRS